MGIGCRITSLNKLKMSLFNIITVILFMYFGLTGNSNIPAIWKNTDFSPGENFLFGELPADEHCSPGEDDRHTPYEQ